LSGDSNLVELFLIDTGWVTQLLPTVKALEASLVARSPRLTNVGRKVASKAETGSRYVHRSLSKIGPRSALGRLLMAETPFAIGDVADMPRL